MKMKKLISLFAALSVVSACSLSAFAEDTTTTTPTATCTKTADGVYDIDVSAFTNEQETTTILAYTGDSISVGSIEFIDQSTSSTFTMGLKNGAPTQDVYVMVGGSGITATLAHTIVPESTAVEEFTISGTVSGYVGSTLPTVIVSDGTTDYPASVEEDGTFTVDVPVLAEGSYTLTATKAGHLKYTKANVTDVAVTATLKAGDMNADNIANVSDMALIVDNYNAENGDDGYTVAYDVNEDNIMNVSDMALVVDNYNAESISE